MEATNKPSKINLRSEEITEILGVPPKWIIRWGITIIFIVVAIIFIGSVFFRYPDLVVAPATITSENPPSVIISKANGKITDLLFPDGSIVEKGDTIAVIENPANLKDIELLSKAIQNFRPQGAKPNAPFESNKFEKLALGDVQSQFNAFSKSYTEYNLFLKQNYHDKKVKAIESEVNQYKQYYNRLQKQQILTQKDLEITKKQFSRDSLLYISNVISAVDYERSQANVLSKQQALENSRLNLSNASITIEKLNQNIIDTRLEQESQNKKMQEDLINNYNQLISTLSAWEKTYLLIAPSSGKLTYMNIWSNLQEVRSGDRLFTINPKNRGKVFASLTVPFEGVGKVKPGQRVTLKIDGYPYMEFGVVEGTIQSVSSGSVEKGFPAIVCLSSGAVTSYGQELSFERDLSARAEITTEELTLLQRFFNPLKYIFKNRISK